VAPCFGKIQAPNQRYQRVTGTIPAFTVQLGPKVEAAISRCKRVIGDTMKSRHDARRATEVAIAVKSLNRMNELGRAKFVRMA
jgi:hypothetical protein